METFSNELSCLRNIFSLAKMLNENWEFKPIKDFLINLHTFGNITVKYYRLIKK